MAELYDLIDYMFTLGQLLALGSLPYFVALVIRFRHAPDSGGRETSGEPALAIPDAVAALAAKVDGAGPAAVQHGYRNSLNVRAARVVSV